MNTDNALASGLGSVFEKTDRIITGNAKISVDAHLADNRSYSIGDAITLGLSGLNLGSSTDVTIALGRNYHEVAHTMFTPRLDEEGKSLYFLDENDQSNYWHSSFNYLEESRIETLFSAMFGKSKFFFTVMFADLAMSDDDPGKFSNAGTDKEKVSALSLHLLAHGRAYLPEEVRIEIRNRALSFFSTPEDVSRIEKGEKIIDAYRVMSWTELSARSGVKNLDRWQLAVSRFANLFPEIFAVDANNEDGKCSQTAAEKNNPRDHSARGQRPQSRKEREEKKEQEKSASEQAKQDKKDDYEEVELPDDSDEDEDDANEGHGDGEDTDQDDQDGTGDSSGDEEDGDDESDAPGGSESDSGTTEGDEETEPGDSDSEDDGDTGDGDGSGDSSKDSDDQDDQSTGSGSGSGSGPGGDDESESDDPGAGTGSQEITPQSISEQQEMLNSIVERIVDNSSVSSEIDRMVQDVSSMGEQSTDAGVVNRRPELPEERDAISEVSQIMESLRDRVAPGWVYGSDHGKLNVSRIMAGADFEEMYDEWSEGREDDASVEVVLLLDQSGSMQQNGKMASASSLCHVIRKSLAVVDAHVSVYGFSDATRVDVLKGRDDQTVDTDVPVYEIMGYTYVYEALKRARDVFAASECPNRILFVVTDGIWSNRTYSTDGPDAEYRKLLSEISATKVLSFIDRDGVVRMPLGLRYVLELEKLFDFNFNANRASDLANPMLELVETIVANTVS